MRNVQEGPEKEIPPVLFVSDSLVFLSPCQRTSSVAMLQCSAGPRQGRGGEGRGEEGRAGAHGHDGQSKAPTLKGEEMRERERDQLLVPLCVCACVGDVCHCDLLHFAVDSSL